LHPSFLSRFPAVLWCSQWRSSLPPIHTGLISMHAHRWFSLLALTFLFCSTVAVLPAAAQDEAEGLTEETEEEDAEKLMGQTEALDWALVVALCLAGTHFSAPRLRRFIEPQEAKISSLGGGMAASYVFIHLMSELDEGGELVGSKIHHFVLFGFIIYYGIEYYLKRSKRGLHATEPGRLDFSIQVGIGWIYTWLIMYSMPESIQRSGFKVVPALVALILHLIYSDFHFGKEFSKLFDRWGRFILASAPLIGWAGDVFYFQDNPAVSDLLVALLAGAVIYKLFKHELPDHDKSSFVWFLVGVLVFVALDIAAH